ncbi:MAG: SAM-dependent methyltransferase [Xanthomonadales bacterium]|jgi:hypothetical protein|nr:SAM-dependent methyltransferase [Xanthomonadales bacterium]
MDARSPTPDWHARLLTLQAGLAALAEYWRPAPFRERRPDWCATHPALATAVLGLDDAALEALAADPTAAQAWLTPQLPALTELAALTELPALPTRTLPRWPARADSGIPGRKAAQIEAFVAAMPPASTPVLDWCAGKGHLGRRVALADGVGLTMLERDPALATEAARLATRVGLSATVEVADACTPAALARVAGRTVLALHACGELHRGLVRGAAAYRAAAYRIAPCCYPLAAGPRYQPLSRVATLDLDASALKLAVTETVTAPLHDRRRLAREQALKLGYLALHSALNGRAPTRLKPVPPAWLQADFQDGARQLAAREGLQLPTTLDWAHWQAEGERRRGEVRRLELVRQAFRRALEVWLVLDLAVALTEAGYAVRLGPFCARTLSPRNLLLLADRA